MATKEKKTEKTWAGRQSWNYEAFWLVNGRKVRITIRVDAYRFQSWGRASVLNRAKDDWNVLATIPGEELAVFDAISYVSKDVSPHVFTTDEQTLLKTLSWLLD